MVSPSSNPVPDNPLESILAINKKIGWESYEESFRDRFSCNPDSFIIKKVDNLVVGYLILENHGTKGYIPYLGIDPAYQGKGLGQELMKEAFNKLKADAPETSLVLEYKVIKRSLHDCL